MQVRTTGRREVLTNWTKPTKNCDERTDSIGRRGNGRTSPEILLLAIENVDLVEENDGLRRMFRLGRRLLLRRLRSRRRFRRSRLAEHGKRILRSRARRLPPHRRHSLRPRVDHVVLPDVANVSLNVLRTALADAWEDFEDAPAELVRDGVDGGALA